MSDTCRCTVYCLLKDVKRFTGKKGINFKILGELHNGAVELEDESFDPSSDLKLLPKGVMFYGNYQDNGVCSSAQFFNFSGESRGVEKWDTTFQGGWGIEEVCERESREMELAILISFLKRRWEVMFKINPGSEGPEIKDDDDD